VHSFLSFLAEAADLSQRLRALPTVTRASSWSSTDFVLPDGTALSITTSRQTHAMIVAPLFGIDPDDVNGRNTALADVLKAGVVRVVHDGIDIGGLMTERQAETISDGFARSMNMHIRVDVQNAERQQVIDTRTFDNPVKPSVLRAWVNSRV
jgi:hypothetical protein